MNDIDRLAELLHAEWDRYRACEPSEPGAPCHYCICSATRLIAAGVTLAPTPPDAPLDRGLVERNGDLRDALLAARRVFQEHMIRLGRYTGNTHIGTFARAAIEDIDKALDAPKPKRVTLAPTPPGGVIRTP